MAVAGHFYALSYRATSRYSLNLALSACLGVDCHDLLCLGCALYYKKDLNPAWARSIQEKEAFSQCVKGVSKPLASQKPNTFKKETSRPKSGKVSTQSTHAWTVEKQNILQALRMIKAPICKLRLEIDSEKVRVSCVSQSSTSRCVLVIKKLMSYPSTGFRRRITKCSALWVKKPANFRQSSFLGWHRLAVSMVRFTRDYLFTCLKTGSTKTPSLAYCDVSDENHLPLYVLYIYIIYIHTYMVMGQNPSSSWTPK